jgi:N6-adenosine-specific RNA methylase IME4
MTGFGVIVIDPPWDVSDEGDANQVGRANPHYVTMPIAEILKMPVKNIAAADCRLYLWITNRSLFKGLDLIDAWGFRYVTCLTWAKITAAGKPAIGMGKYFRGSTEQILFAVRGSQANVDREGGWFAAQRGKHGHSSKPVEIYQLIESREAL